MREEQFTSYSLPNEYELFYNYIKTVIEKEGIEVHRFSIDDTVTTNKEVPEEIKSRIREYAAYKGIPIKFEVSGQEN